MAKKPGPPKGVRIGGRQKGTPNKATADVKALAREHGADAIKRLAHLMQKAESEQAQVAACKELLDRAYGKPAQAIVGDDEAPIKTVMEIVWGGTSGSSAGKS
jgi:hypothetical protein